MKTVIMAGGKGTRIASVNAEVPKPMIRILNKPILEYQLECLRDQGYRDIILVIGHLGHVVREYFGDGSGVSPATGKPFGVRIEYVVETEPLGTAGALVINNPAYNERAEILREKGANRSKFYRGQVDKYTWVDFGDSYLPSEMNAAYLWGQLEKADEINNDRLATWKAYYEAFRPLADAGKVVLPTVPEGCVHNGHMFYLKCKSLRERTALISFLKERGIQAVFHYIPLHSAPAGLKYGRFYGEDVYTTSESDCLVRLPMYYGLRKEDLETIIQAVRAFYKNKAMK